MRGSTTAPLPAALPPVSPPLAAAPLAMRVAAEVTAARSRRCASVKSSEAPAALSLLEASSPFAKFGCKPRATDSARVAATSAIDSKGSWGTYSVRTHVDAVNSLPFVVLLPLPLFAFPPPPSLPLWPSLLLLSVPLLSSSAPPEALEGPRRASVKRGDSPSSPPPPSSLERPSEADCCAVVFCLNAVKRGGGASVPVTKRHTAARSVPFARAKHSHTPRADGWLASKTLEGLQLAFPSIEGGEVEKELASAVEGVIVEDESLFS